MLLHIINYITVPDSIVKKIQIQFFINNLYMLNNIRNKESTNYSAEMMRRVVPTWVWYTEDIE